MSHNKTDGLHDLDDKNNTDATSVFFLLIKLTIKRCNKKLQIVQSTEIKELNQKAINISNR